MKTGRLFLLALQNPQIKLDEKSEILAFIHEMDLETFTSPLEDLKLSRLDLDGMEKDFLSIGGCKL